MRVDVRRMLATCVACCAGIFGLWLALSAAVAPQGPTKTLGGNELAVGPLPEMVSPSPGRQLDSGRELGISLAARLASRTEFESLGSASARRIAAPAFPG